MEISSAAQLKDFRFYSEGMEEPLKDYKGGC